MWAMDNWFSSGSATRRREPHDGQRRSGGPAGSAPVHRQSRQTAFMATLKVSVTLASPQLKTGRPLFHRTRRPVVRGPAGQVMMSKKVLIVEDNELNMKLFHDLLDSQGYETLQTREGLQALALARAHHPDLILMDIQLPEISGLEVTKWLKDDEELNHIPVIAVTAFAMKGDEERIRQGGCEAYISKPISVMHFLETIRQHLG